MAVLRQRIGDILIAGRTHPADATALASGFINLALGDAYVEAAIGLGEADAADRFAAQIEAAVRFALPAQ